MRKAATAALLLLFSVLSWWVFPGHAWLQQDTQIYAPILEHLHEPSVLAKDIIVERPHVAFTFYDEIALLFRSITGSSFYVILMAEQILFRAMGLWGIYLIATALGLDFAPAMLVTLIWSLGATINGPAVLTVEYEPVPRGFAVPLLMLAVGLAAQGRWMWSGVATGAAALFHAPAVWPILAVYVWAAPNKVSRWALAPVVGAVVLLLAASRYQIGVTEAQSFFSVVSPKLEMLQRMRAPYNWLDLWWREYLGQYVFLAGVCATATWRLWDRMPSGLRPFSVGLPLAGLASMPLSWLFLNQWKWALMPQVQPMRALLFVTAMASVLSACAGCVAAERKKFGEAFLWFLTPWILPIQTRLFTAPAKQQWAVWLVCAVLSVVVCTRRNRVWIMAAAYWAMAATVTLYPNLHAPELRELSKWARDATRLDAVFVFPDNGKANFPGVFRSEALRAVYVDWKGGGQVNYLPQFGEEWWHRWQSVAPGSESRFKQLGVDYVVRKSGNSLDSGLRVFENSKYWVYKLK